MFRALISGLLAFAPAATFGQSQLARPATPPALRNACHTAMTAPLPADIAAVPIPRTYPTCNSYKLYDSGNFAAARACALRERAALVTFLRGSPSASHTEDERPAAGGLAVLTLLYANGQGVPKVPTIAARFYCEAIDTGEVEVSTSPTDPQAITTVLEQLQHLEPDSPPFVFCDPGGNPVHGIFTTHCEALALEAQAESHMGGIQEAFDDAEKAAHDADRAIVPALRKLTPAQRAAYNRLAAAMQRFINIEKTGDALSTGPYGTEGLYPQEQHAAFENQVLAWVRKPPPQPSPTDLQQADASLNEKFTRLVAAAALVADPAFYQVENRVSPQDLRDEQRAWLAYRDAFVAFGKILAPNLPPTAWLVPLTSARANDLKQINDSWGKAWTDAAQKHTEWLATANASESAKLSESRSKVNAFFDHQTPAQSAAWDNVQRALKAYADATRQAEPNTPPEYEQTQLEDLFAELYAFQYNAAHGFFHDEPPQSIPGTPNDKKLNQAFAADLAAAGLYTPRRYPFPPTPVYRSTAALRNEQRAWIALRDAWVSFRGNLFYPHLSEATRANMLTGHRTFELDMKRQNLR